MPTRPRKVRKTSRRTNPTSDFPIGRIAGPFGVRGELKCDPTSAGRTVFSAGKALRCARKDGDSTVRIAGVREHKGRLLLRLDGVEDADAAQSFTGATFYAPREALEVNDGEFLDADLVGCSVEGADGRIYGTVEDVQHFPASDMLVVGGRMVPMVRAIVTSIDVGAKRIVIDPPAELLD